MHAQAKLPMPITPQDRRAVSTREGGKRQASGKQAAEARPCTTHDSCKLTMSITPRKAVTTRVGNGAGACGSEGSDSITQIMTAMSSRMCSHALVCSCTQRQEEGRCGKKLGGQVHADHGSDATSSWLCSPAQLLLHWHRKCACTCSSRPSGPGSAVIMSCCAELCMQLPGSVPQPPAPAAAARSVPASAGGASRSTGSRG